MSFIKIITFFFAFCLCESSFGACDDRGYYLFVSADALKVLMLSDERLLKSQFDRCNVIVGGRRNVLRKGFDIGLNVRRRMTYKSLHDFESDLYDGKLTGVVDAVVYNPEPAFLETPIEEKLNPVKYAIRFARLARENGLLSVAAPSCRLVKEKDALNRFRMCANDIFSSIAPYYDFIDIQAQSTQGDINLYERIIREVAKIIRSSDRKVKIIAQVSTVDAIGGSAETMGEAAMKTKDVVDGFWINIDNKSLDGKADFIEMIMKYNIN